MNPNKIKDVNRVRGVRTELVLANVTNVRANDGQIETAFVRDARLCKSWE